jgi:hypothetical protein
LNRLLPSYASSKIIIAATAKPDEDCLRYGHEQDDIADQFWLLGHSAHTRRANDALSIASPDCGQTNGRARANAINPSSIRCKTFFEENVW